MTRLLLIEDEENERFTLGRALELSGFEVVAVGSVNAAREALEGPGYDVVVTDVFMPGCDGLSFARELATRCPGVPIVLMSAFPFSASQVTRLDIPHLVFVPKPVDIDRLVATLRDPGAPKPAEPLVTLPSLRRRTALER